MIVTKDMRGLNGQLPSHTSIGGYSLLYLKGGTILCAKCASEAKGHLEVDTYDEGEDLHCEECDAVIESSYGPVEEKGANPYQTSEYHH